MVDKMTDDILRPIRCTFCGIHLIGREQFIGHMVHSHDLGYEELAITWDSKLRAISDRRRTHPQHVVKDD